MVEMPREVIWFLSAVLIVIVMRTVSKDITWKHGYTVHALLKDATGLAPRSRARSSSRSWPSRKAVRPCGTLIVIEDRPPVTPGEA